MLGQLFSTQIWLTIVTLLSHTWFLWLITRSSDRLLDGIDNTLFGWAFVIFSIVYIGLRPLECYGDSWLYSKIFNLVQSGRWADFKNPPSEWLWTAVEWFFVKTADCQMWYLFISTCYAGLAALALRRWFPRHFNVSVMFMVTAMSFFPYATNGLRNGMATSVILLGLSLCLTGRWRTFAGLLIIFMAGYIHRTSVIIFAAAVVALFLHDYKYTTLLWLFCILLGLVFSEQFKALIPMLSSDMRSEYYTQMQVASSLFSRTGFRWDFVLYSSVPVALGWLVRVRTFDTDRTYTFLLNTYILLNAGWALINSVAFSNRFAYLSWFLYPVLVVYPFVRFRLIPRQGIMLGWILLVYTCFCIVMN